MPRLCDRIGVIGAGVIGQAHARGFMEHCGEVRVHDVLPERSTHTLLEALDCDWTFVCVPTPAGSDGRCDTTAVEKVLAECLASHPTGCRPGQFVIKSTVPVGFTRRMHDNYGKQFTILHSPEFLTARCSLIDFQTPARNIIGIPPTVRSASNPCEELQDAVDGLVSLYERRFPGVPCLQMSSDESELVKLAQNGFFATKVAYFNAIYQLAKATGCNFDAVRAGMLADGRIAHAHTEVPGPSGGVGYSGNCLPKDMENLIAMFKDADLNEWFWLSAVQRNNQLRRRQ